MTPTIVAPVDAEQRADDAFERAPGEPAVVGAEREQQPERHDDQAGAKRAHVDELAPRDHQQAQDEERSGRDVGSRADRAAAGRPRRAADDAALPAEPEERREEDPDSREDEAPELGMVVPALALLAPALLDPRGNARAQRTLTLLARHGRGFDAPPYSPCREVLGGEGPQVLERAAEQVLPEVEQAGPEARRVDLAPPLRGARQALERPHEDRELEVDLRDARG